MHEYEQALPTPITLPLYRYRHTNKFYLFLLFIVIVAALIFPQLLKDTYIAESFHRAVDKEFFSFMFDWRASAALLGILILGRPLGVFAVALSLIVVTAVTMSAGTGVFNMPIVISALILSVVQVVLIGIASLVVNGRSCSTWFTTFLFVIMFNLMFYFPDFLSFFNMSFMPADLFAILANWAVTTFFVYFVRIYFTSRPVVAWRKELEQKNQHVMQRKTYN